VSTHGSDARTLLDTEHLRMLAICHFVAAGLAVVGVAFSSLYLVLIQTVFANPRMWANSPQGPPPTEMISVFRWAVALFVLWFLVSAVGNLLSGLFLRARRHRAFSMVVAGINCVHIPVGTVLGIFTFIVLARDSVRNAYQAEDSLQLR
jgi:hypothetical protein